MKLNRDQADALAEIFNIGIGRAAAALADICGHEVQLRVPHVSLDEPEAAQPWETMLEERRHCLGVGMTFTGYLEAAGLLVFAERGALELVRLALRRDDVESSLTELEHEAMSEIGNIMFNHWIGEMANVLGEEVHSSLPSVRSGTYQDLLAEVRRTESGDPVLIVRVDLNVAGTEIRGNFLVALRSPQLENLIGRLISHYFGQPRLVTHA